jgi:hypothetical protein
MHERLGLTAELVLRGSGLAGVLVAVGGGAAVLALAVPWQVARAELAMLGDVQDRTVTELAGWQLLPWGALAAIGGAVAVVLGLTLAFDRHPGWTRPAALSAGSVTVVSGVVAVLHRRRLGGFPDGDGSLADLRAVADQLPVGVELSLSVEPAPGAVLAVLGGLLVVAGTLCARELDRT